MMAESQPQPVKVAFLGPPASFTHQAALKEFASSHFELELQDTIKEVFEAVQRKETTYGVIPFENSSNGAVVQTLDLFSDREGALADISVCGEIFVDIQHCLLGYDNGLVPGRAPSPGYATPTIDNPRPVASRSRPLSDVTHIKHIYSHPQAFGQSFTFLNTYLKNAEIHEVSSTSKGAEIVAEEEDSAKASISSETAAELLGLMILARGIQDRSDNTTKFFVITRESGKELTANGPWKSLVGFSIDHKKPGALADALGVFKTNKLNLTSIHDRPSRRRPWHYMFFVEFEGKVGGSGGEAGDAALRMLKEYAEEMRWYGSWRMGNMSELM